MLTLNFTNKVTFDVNVHGTAATPTVRCVVGEYPGLMYQATRLTEGKFEVIIDLPPTMRSGAYPFKIEVMLNGRMFTPINTQINVEGGFENSVSDERIAELEPTPVQPLWSVLQHAAVKTKEVSAPLIVPQKESLIKEVAKNDEPVRQITKPAEKPIKRPTVVKPAEPVKEQKPIQIPPKPTMSALESVVKAPVQKRKKPASAAAPVLEHKPVKFSMADVANDVAKSEPAVPAQEPTVVVEQVTAVPLTLIKGEVIYK
jgi:hypothetical protein